MHLGWQVGPKIGEGSFAVVHRGRNLATNQTVAIKIIKTEDELGLGNPSAGGLAYLDVLAAMKTEVKLMEHIGQHPNVVQVLGRDEDAHVYIMPAASNDLYKLIKKEKYLPHDTMQKFAQGICSGVSHIHSMGVAHQDLKSSNILVFSDLTLKICDFGLARKLPKSKIIGVDRELCTLWYRAPELLMVRRTCYLFNGQQNLYTYLI